MSSDRVHHQLVYGGTITRRLCGTMTRRSACPRVRESACDASTARAVSPVGLRDDFGAIHAGILGERQNQRQPFRAQRRATTDTEGAQLRPLPVIGPQQPDSDDGQQGERQRDRER
jgi:hypothetical protein